MVSVFLKEVYRLFVVEDNPAEVRLIKEAIKDADCTELLELTYAYDGEEAIDLLEAMKNIESKFDLILLDIHLPKLNGKDVLMKIKSDLYLESTPVIIVTNSDYRKDMIDCYALGADGYFQKPADFKKLVDFFISIKRSIEVKKKLSVYFIEKVYDELGSGA